jgi:hypothetical protein
MVTVDTTNRHLVSLGGNRVVVMSPPRMLTKQQAFELAAWLVVTAEMLDGEAPTLEEARAAIENA